jgi:predicted DNA-binding transcriptional regulator AlpA
VVNKASFAKDKIMTMIAARQVRKHVGNISDMTLYRWLHNERLNFPKPIVIQNRRYWREEDVDRWLSERALISIKGSV